MRLIANVCALALALTVAQAQGGEDTTAVTPDAGRSLQQGERLSIYDSKGKRVGSAVRRPDGSLDLFGVDGSPRGTIQKDTGSGAQVERFDSKGNRGGSAVQQGERLNVFDSRGNRVGSAVQQGERLDLSDSKGNRVGSAVQQGERLDLSDSKGNRIGYGHQRPDGSWDVFGMDGSRRGTIQKDTGSGARATTPGKR